ncbi:hypothetical protein [Treponema denticola]|uniref:hypothetical protein n=1 Tax=Treponema denticola TaxID=158 RepID=UPI0021074E12|nr:hypothetical protein [Treponema denticola]UTY24510.1 hypothetical protein E4N78_10525 [Treponema denticola]
MWTRLKKPKNRPSSPPPSIEDTKYKISITQPANGKIEVSPALPADGKVDKGSELTFTLSANTGHKVKELIINGITYSDVTDNTITQKVKIEKNTAVSAVVEEEASQPAEQITIGNSVIYVTKDAGGNIIKVSGTIFLNEIEELAQKSTNNIVINTDALTIKSFNDTGIIEVAENDLQAVINKLSVLNIENQDFTKQSITLNIENNKLKITSITGNISLQDIMDSNESNKGIAKYIANNLKEKTNPDFDSTNLKINTFHKKRNSENIEWEYISTPITPKFLKETKLNALNKAVLNFKDGDVNVPVAFKSTLTDYFDVNEFYKEVTNGKLNILQDTNITVKNDKANNIQILLRDLQQTITHGTNAYNITPYIKADQILELINNEKLKDALVIGDMYVKGNVKDLLPKLVGKNDGIKFLNVKEFTCPGPNVTEYNGGKDNTEPLPVEQLLEFRRRTNEKWDSVLKKDTRSTRIQNLVLNNVNTTTMTEEDLKLLNFEGNSVTGNIVFKNSNLSKMRYEGTTGPVNLTFDNTTLPYNMAHSEANTIILKDVTFPKEQFDLGQEYEFIDIPYNVPTINYSLEIHGKIKNSPLEGKGDEVLNTLVPQENMPENYTGSLEIYNKLKKYIYRGEAKTINGNTNPNYHGSIKKQQNQLLALLQTQNKSRS